MTGKEIILNVRLYNERSVIVPSLRRTNLYQSYGTYANIPKGDLCCEALAHSGLRGKIWPT